MYERIQHLRKVAGLCSQDMQVGTAVLLLGPGPLGLWEHDLSASPTFLAQLVSFCQPVPGMAQPFPRGLGCIPVLSEPQLLTQKGELGSLPRSMLPPNCGAL